MTAPRQALPSGSRERPTIRIAGTPTIDELRAYERGDDALVPVAFEAREADIFDSDPPMLEADDFEVREADIFDTAQSS